MHFATSLIAALVSLCSLQVVLAGHIDLSGRMVHKRSPVVGAEGSRDLDLPPRQELRKRAEGRFTFYKTGLGACGGRNVDSDFIVAMNHGQFDSGHWCGKTVTISFGGKTAQAVVADRCEECPYGALDLSPGLFNYFASAGAGVIYGSWVEGSAPKPEPTTSKPKPSPTPTPTTTWTPPPEETSTTTSTTSTTTSSTTSSTSSAEPSATPKSALEDGNLFQLNEVILNLGSLMAFAARARVNADVNVNVNVNVN